MQVTLALRPDLIERFLLPDDQARLTGIGPVEQLADVSDLTAAADAGRLGATEILLTGWGTGMVDKRVLDRAPQLAAVVYTAGSVRGVVTPEVLERGIIVSSQAINNARPVAEYTVAMILLAGKDVFGGQHRYRTRRAWVEPTAEFAHAGNYQRVVGLIGASRIGRRVLELLKPYDLQVLISDPYLSAEEASTLGAELVELDELLTRALVISLHAPLLPDTRGLINADRLARIRTGATFINTARGALVDQDTLIAELSTGRFNAILDVTDPEVSPPDSPLWDLDNVVLTPHLAGALGNELSRLGAAAVDEAIRVSDGRPLAFPVTRSDYDRLA